jgi:TonB family protein
MHPHNPSHTNHGVLKALQHWSPLVLLSLIANLGLLYLFVVLIAVTEPHATEYNRLNVLLVQNEPQEQPVPLRPVPEAVKPPEPKKKIVKKPKLEKPKTAVKPPPPKKVVQAKTPQPPAPKPDNPPDSVDPAENETVELAVQEQTATSEPKETPNTQSREQTPLVPEAVPLFRLTRMPKVVNYNLETLKRYYPKEERDFGKEATVEALILVDENGDIVEVEIIKSAGARFDAAAKKALLSKALVIQPGYVGNQPVASRVPIPITFNLTD